MIYLQEVTEWNTTYEVQNHIYYVSDDKTKAVGYIPQGKRGLVKFSKPMTLDRKGRKFVKLNKTGERDEVYFGVTAVEQPAADVITVSGSGGKTYYISKMPGRITCTCPGFQFRNKCKHVDVHR